MRYIDRDSVDIVIPWVDATDESWLSDRLRYEKTDQNDTSNNSNIRFQSWDNLYLWFRSIEVCMPWVNRIFFITYGHLPSFLKTNHPKLRIIKHQDYMPKEYLPTFNSGTIEMNVHRIAELSDNYIMFNDDTFPLVPTREDYFFRDGVPCDEAVEGIISTGSFTDGLKWMRYAQVNHMFIINKYFKKREVQQKHHDKWFCEDYGDRLERTKACAYWYDFPGFYDPHMANALKKSTLEHLWEIEPEALDAGSRNRFRGYSDVTQYLIRYWQLCEGNFHPRRTQGKVFFPTIDTYQEVVDAIVNRTYPMVSINENCTPEEFAVMKKAINEALETLFPEKCSYEK